MDRIGLFAESVGKQRGLVSRDYTRRTHVTCKCRINAPPSKRWRRRPVAFAYSLIRKGGLADKKCVWGDYSVEYGYAALRWNSDHVSPLPHSTGSMLGTGFPE